MTREEKATNRVTAASPIRGVGSDLEKSSDAIAVKRVNAVGAESIKMCGDDFLVPSILQGCCTTENKVEVIAAKDAVLIVAM